MWPFEAVEGISATPDGRWTVLSTGTDRSTWGSGVDAADRRRAMGERASCRSHRLEQMVE
jgi:hypothetical protein